jgi:hypothetical protein
MPYTRKGNCVYKETGKKMGCSKDAKAAEKYMSALYAAEKGNLKEGFEPETIDPNEPELAVTVELPNPTQVMASFISTLMSSRTQAHIFHWRCKGVGAGWMHTALGAYYEGIIDLVDSLVESVQGRYGLLEGFKGEGQFIEDTSKVLPYFEALCMYVEKNRVSLPQDSYIQNQIDEIVALIETTKYKLVNLQ